MKIDSSRRKGGIANLIAELIIIVIVLATALMLYVIVVHTTTTLTTNTEFFITNAQATYVQSTGATVLTVTIKNVGSTGIAALSLAVDGVTVPSTWQPNPPVWPIPEGGSATTFLLRTGMVQGTDHVITVTETGVEGSTYAQTETVATY